MTCFPDTHALAWLLAGSLRLSRAARDALTAPTGRMVVSALVLAEIHHLHARGRIAVDLSTVPSYISATAGCAIQPLDEHVLAHLPTSLDIHDAIIVATALYYRDGLGEAIALITRDAAIQASGLVPVIW